MLDLTTIEGRTLSVRVVKDVAAVEERITDERSTVFQGARSKVYVDAGRSEIRGSKADTVALISALGGFLDTAIFTTYEGREIEIRTEDISNVVAGIEDIRDSVYTGVRSSILFGNSHSIIVRKSAADVLTDIGLPNTGIVFVVATPYTVVEGDRWLFVDDDLIGSDVTINLPDTEFIPGREISVKKSGTTGSVIIDAFAAQLIDELETLTIIFQNDAPDLVSDGFNWKIF